MKSRNFVQSLGYALNGLRYALRTERNMKIHACAAVLVLVASWWLRIETWQTLIVLVAIAFVVFAELMNTVVEHMVDLLTAQLHPHAKVAKDVAAGAVLVAAGFAVVAGVLVFAGPLWERMTFLLS
ncbi:MAG: hypothetical protein A6D91_01010 [Bacillaceae bacterium G1]|nr:diacylglycerol kinase [Bacillota bacterium]OJF18027.1 MAG: hypothetical protein A6D91_01010 [Bacillaceae bacterium G1]